MKKIYSVSLLILMAILLTGCIQIKKSTSATDGGIFKSINFGESWKQKVTVLQEEKGIQTIANVNIRFMVFDPRDKNTIYLVTEGAGIFKTVNSGEDWQPTTLSSGTYKSLSIDYLNNNVIYATDGNKIIKTVDGMETWQTIYNETRPGQELVSLIVDPFKFGIIYAATTSSIIKSSDYGNTWQLLSWQEPNISGLYLSQKNANVLYALTNKGLYKSTNAGLTWVDINEGLKNFEGALTIYWLTFYEKTEDIILGTAAGILRSLDGGRSWTVIPTLFDFKKVPIKTVIFNPNNLNEIIFAVNNVLHKTSNGGKTWKSLKSVPTSRIINYLVADPYHEDIIYSGTVKPKKR